MQTGRTARAIAADVGDLASLTDAAEQMEATLGTVDVLVDNAGVMLPGDINCQPISEWDRMIDTNLTGALHAIHAFLPALLDAAAKDGIADLINISSIGGKLVFPPLCRLRRHQGGTHAVVGDAPRRAIRARRAGDRPPTRANESELAGNVTDGASRAQLERMFNEISALRPADIAELVVYLISRPRMSTSPRSTSCPPDRREGLSAPIAQRDLANKGGLPMAAGSGCQLVAPRREVSPSPKTNGP